MINLRRGILYLLMLGLLGGGGCSKQSRRNSYISKGDAYFKAEQYEKAEIEYLNAQKVVTLDPVAIRQLGIIYYEQGRLPQAYFFLQKAVELNPENVEVRLKLGLTYLSVRKMKEADEVAMWVLAKQPGNEEALSLMASAASTAKEIQEIQQRIEKFRQQDTDKAGYHLALGTLYFRQRETTKAEDEFNKALALDPKSSAAQVALGSVYWARDDLKKAEQAFKIAADLSPFRSARHLKYVDFKLQTGGVAEAKKALEEITQKAPDYLPAWTYLMQVAFAERRVDDCAALVKKVLAQDSRNFDALLLSGNLKLVQGDTDKAIAEFERLRALFDAMPQLHYQMALAYLMNKDMGKAMGSLNQALTLAPDYPEAVLLQAELNIRSGNFASAITTLTQLSRTRPQVARTYLLLASAYLAQKNTEEAMVVYSQMAKLFPKSAEVPLLIGVVLAQKNPEAARKSFEKSLELSPDFLPTVEQLVNLDILDQRYASAQDRIKKLAEKNPRAGEPHLLFAKIHLAQTNLNLAEADLLKAIELNPELRTPYLLLAQLYVSSNKHQQALDRLGTLAKTNDVTALMQIGMIYNQLTNYPAARDAYEKLLKTESKSTMASFALNNLAYLYSEKLGQFDKAYEMAERARRLLPYDPYTADTLGWILFKRGEYPRALGLLQESVASLPTQPEIQFHLGMTHYMMSEEELARLALQRAEELTVEASKRKDLAVADFSGKDECHRRLAVLAIDPKTAGAESVAFLEKGLRDDPADPVALTRLAAIYERDGADEKAVKTYEVALKQNPKNTRVMFRLAQLYSSRLNDQRKALELAKTAHNLSPEDPYISQLLSRLVFRTGDFKWALSLIQEVVLKLPNQPEFLYDLAWSYYSVGRVTDAEATMRTSIQKGLASPKLEDAKHFLAMVAATKNLTQDNVAAAQNLLTSDADYIPALMLSALWQEKQSNYSAAQELYSKILDRFPLFAPAVRQLAILYANSLNDDKKAYEFALKAREAMPEDAELAKTLGVLSYRRNDYPRAIQLLKEVVSRRNNDAELMYYLGMAQYRTKDSLAAKSALQQAISLNLSPKLVIEAKRALDELK